MNHPIAIMLVFLVPLMLYWLSIKAQRSRYCSGTPPRRHPRRSSPRNSLSDYPGFCYLRAFSYTSPSDTIDPFFDGLNPGLIMTRAEAYQKYGRYPTLPRGALGWVHVVGDRLLHVKSLYPSWFPRLSPAGRYGADVDFFYDTAHRNVVMGFHVPGYQRLVELARRSCPWHVPASMLRYLHSAGLQSPPPHAPIHQHPVHAALDQHVLRFVRPLLKEGRWTALFLKKERAEEAGLPPPDKYINPTLVGKDIMRYQSTPLNPFTTPRSLSPVWLCHTVLQHVTPSEIGSWFDENPTLQALIATAVIPPELLFGLPPTSPDLYTFSDLPGDQFLYTPEGDRHGAYVQPKHAVQWLRANRLITPANTCLHVSMITSAHAHHVFAITRKQLIAETHRSFDMGDVLVVPWWVLPFCTKQQRTTITHLHTRLTRYAMGVETSIKDLYNKARQLQIEDTRYPDWAIRPAVHHAYALWLLEQTISARYHYGFFFLFSFLLDLPFVPPYWIYRSLIARSFLYPYSSGSPSHVSLHTIVSHPTDERIPWARTPCSPAVDLFHLSPSPTWLESFAVLNAAGCSFFFLKVGLVEPLRLAWDHRTWLGIFIRDVWWAVDWTPGRFILFLLAAALSSWFRLLPSSPGRAARTALSAMFPNIWSVRTVLSWCLRVIFVLPSANLPIQVGGSFPWQLFLLSQFLGSAFPRLLPWYLRVNRWPGLVRYLVGLPAPQDTREFRWVLVLLVTLTLSLVYGILCRHRARYDAILPRHADVRSYGTNGSPPAPPPVHTPGPMGFTILPLLPRSLASSAPFLDALIRPPLRCAILIWGALVRCRVFLLFFPVALRAIWFLTAGAVWIFLAITTFLTSSVIILASMYFAPRYRLAKAVVAYCEAYFAFMLGVYRNEDVLPHNPRRYLILYVITLPITIPLLFLPLILAQFVRALFRCIWHAFGWLSTPIVGAQPPDNFLGTDDVEATNPQPPPPAPAPLVVLTPPSEADDDGPVEDPVLPPAPPPAPAVPPPPVPDLDDRDIPQYDRVFDPLSGYRVNPTYYDTTETWGSLMRRLPIPAQPRLDEGLMCVWRAVGLTLGLDEYLVWANFTAFQTNGERQRFETEPPRWEDLSRIFAHFRLGVEVYGATLVGNDIQSATDSPALITVPPTPGWPTAVFAYTQGDGRRPSHLYPHPPVFVATIFTAAPRPNSLVSEISRRVPYAEVAQIMNIPTRAYQQVYHMLTGFAQNAASLASGQYGWRTPQVNPLPPPGHLATVPLRAERIRYTFTEQDRHYAQNLASDLKQNFQELGSLVDSNADIARRLDYSAKFGTLPTVDLVLLNGVTGSGKSHAIRALLAEERARPGFHPSHIRFHAWFQTLRKQLIKDLRPHLPGSNTSQFLSAWNPLYDDAGHTIILDDAGLLPPGFIPLLAMAHPALQRIIVSFDAAQGMAPFPAQDTVTSGDPATAQWLSALSTTYATVGRRLALENAQLFGIPAATPSQDYVPSHGCVYVVSSPPPGVPFCAASPRFIETKKRGGQLANSFAEMQGKDIDGDIAIDLGGLTSAMTDSIMWPVLTRARGSVFLIISPSLPTQSTLQPTSYGCSQILDALLAVAAYKQTAIITPQVDTDGLIKRAVHSHLARTLSPRAAASIALPPPLPHVAGIGPPPRANGFPTSAPSYAPALFIRPLFTPAAAFDHRPQGSHGFNRSFAVGQRGHSHRQELVTDMLRHHWPVTNDQVLRPAPRDPEVPPAPRLSAAPDAKHIHFDEPTPESRERCPTGHAATFQVHEGTATETLKHSRRDLVTDHWSTTKRIRIGKETGKLSKADHRRLAQLITGFRKFFAIRARSVGQHAFDEAVTTSLRSWVSGKSLKELQRQVDASDLDWDPNFLRLFLKSQEVKKPGKLWGPATPGQIVSTMPLTTILEDAVWARYLETELDRVRRPGTYWHAGYNYNGFNSWYKKHWDRKQKGSANDYTAWDRGCDHVFAHFDAWLMEHLGLPESYINKYMNRKLNSRSYLGPHRAMQFSGDRYTWLFNTARNAAITGASLNCPVGTVAAFSGDDSVVLGEWNKPAHFRPSEWLMHPKPEVVQNPLFCGHLFGGPRLAVSADVVLARAKIGIRNGRRDAGYWDSIDYALQFVPDDPSSISLASAAAAISRDARSYYILPPSRHPQHL
uniref:Replicase n=1 Tax=Agaricus bisporus virus 9 TaxID=1945753 RepID=A0A1Q1N6I6_9VIRU|nr:replicase [Agaricus bisporus virus 9]